MVATDEQITISIHTTAKVVTSYFYMCPIYAFISIHTTAKVVTYIWRQHTWVCAISIHTTAKVVTGLPALIVDTLADFNPHHREGGDRRN